MAQDPAAPAVSIIIIAYNQADSIGRCVESVKAQTDGRFEAIVVDDCSTDSTPEAIREAIAGDGRFSFIPRGVNGGEHCARRDGVLASHGECLLFVDGDDTVDPRLVETVVPKWRQSGVDVLRFGLRIVPMSEEYTSVVDFYDRMYNTPFEPCQGEDVMRLMYSTDLFDPPLPWTVIGRVYRGSLARTAFAQMTDQPLRRVADSYETFVLTGMTQSIESFTEYDGINYYLGHGISGLGDDPVGRYEREARGMHETVRAVGEYVAASPDRARLKSYAKWLSDRMLGILQGELYERVPEENQLDALTFVEDEWGAPEARDVLTGMMARRMEELGFSEPQVEHDTQLEKWAEVFRERYGGVPNGADSPAVAHLVTFRRHTFDMARRDATIRAHQTARERVTALAAAQQTRELERIAAERQ